ncbi:MAG: hypothetical protein ACON5A_03205 [Candidatus Comchoanobacterales bacterium]
MKSTHDTIVTPGTLRIAENDINLLADARFLTILQVHCLLKALSQDNFTVDEMLARYITLRNIQLTYLPDREFYGYFLSVDKPDHPLKLIKSVATFNAESDQYRKKENQEQKNYTQLKRLLDSLVNDNDKKRSITDLLQSRYQSLSHSEKVTQAYKEIEQHFIGTNDITYKNSSYFGGLNTAKDHDHVSSQSVESYSLNTYNLDKIMGILDFHLSTNLPIPNIFENEKSIDIKAVCPTQYLLFKIIDQARFSSYKNLDKGFTVKTIQLFHFAEALNIINNPDTIKNSKILDDQLQKDIQSSKEDIKNLLMKVMSFNPPLIKRLKRTKPHTEYEKIVLQLKDEYNNYIDIHSTQKLSLSNRMRLFLHPLKKFNYDFGIPLWGRTKITLSTVMLVLYIIGLLSCIPLPFLATLPIISTISTWSALSQYALMYIPLFWNILCTIGKSKSELITEGFMTQDIMNYQPISTTHNEIKSSEVKSTDIPNQSLAQPERNLSSNDSSEEPEHKSYQDGP